MIINKFLNPGLAPKPIISCAKHPPILPKFDLSIIISATPLENLPKIFFPSSYLNFSQFQLSSKTFILFFFIVCLFVCAVDHGVTEEEPVDEQYREQVCEDQYRDPEPEGQYLD